MDRRTFIASAAAFPLAETATASGGEIMPLYLEWASLNSQVDTLEEAQANPLFDRMREIEHRICAIPSQDMRELSAKICVITCLFDFDISGAGAKSVQAEIMKAVGEEGGAMITSAVTDPHIAWLDEWRAISADYEAMQGASEDSRDMEVLWDRREAIGDMIARTEATTLEGVHAQLAYLVEDFAPIDNLDREQVCYLNAQSALGKAIA